MKTETRVVTGVVRFSYAHVFEPKAMNEGDKPKYSVSLIIPKSDKETLAKIKAGIEAAKKEGVASKFNGKLPGGLRIPLRDGDVDRPDDEAYKNSYFINANSVNAPGIVDANRDDILDKKEFYSGCYGRASISFYAYNSNGNKGIAAGLNNLQKLKDGDPLSAAFLKASDDFAEEGLDSLL